MFNFSLGNKGTSLGVDFGTSSIKIVELEKKNGMLHLLNYGWVEIPSKKNIGELGFDFKAETGDSNLPLLLKKLSDKMKLKANTAHLSMGSYKGLSALVKVNNVSESDLGEIIRLEASKYIPVSLDEVYLSSDIVSRTGQVKESGVEKLNNIFKKGDTNEDMEILLVAAPKDDVHFYEGAVKSSGLEVASFELDIFSAVRSLIGDKPGAFVVVDIGAKITNIIFIESGIIKINRNINIGGDEITKNIASSLNVTWERAEEFKKKNDYLKAEGKAIILPILNIIAKETRRVLDLYSPSQKTNIEGIIMVGGGAEIFGIADIFSESFGSIVSVGNPWKDVMIENDNVREKSTLIAPLYATATGLAMKGLVKN